MFEAGQSPGVALYLLWWMFSSKAERKDPSILAMAIENFISVKETQEPKLAAALEEHVKEYDVDIIGNQKADALLALLFKPTLKRLLVFLYLSSCLNFLRKKSIVLRSLIPKGA